MCMYVQSASKSVSEMLNASVMCMLHNSGMLISYLVC